MPRAFRRERRKETSILNTVSPNRYLNSGNAVDEREKQKNTHTCRVYRSITEAGERERHTHTNTLTPSNFHLPNNAPRKLPIGPVMARRNRNNTSQNMVKTPRPKLLTTRSSGQLKRMRLHHTNSGAAETKTEDRQVNATTFAPEVGRGMGAARSMRGAGYFMYELKYNGGFSHVLTLSACVSIGPPGWCSTTSTYV